MKIESNLSDVLGKMLTELKDTKKIIKENYLHKIKEKIPNIDIDTVDVIIEEGNSNEYSVVFKGLTKEQIALIES